MTKGSDQKVLSGAEKGLLFLVSLEEAVATKILKCMSPEEVRQLRAAAAALPEVEPAALTTVHVEFAQLMERGVPTSLRGSGAYLRRLVGQALGEGKAAELWTETREGSGAVQQLATLDLPTILGIIDREHPQTIAVILSQMAPQRAAEISSQLTPERQAQVVIRLAQLESIPNQVIEQIEKQFATEIASLASGSRQSINGVKAAGDLLKHLENERSEALIEELTSLDPELAERLKKALFTFDDMMRIDARGMQVVLKEISTENLVLALKTASEEIREKVFGSVSSRAAAMIREELELLGPTRLADVEAAQQMIVEAALRLEREGRIQIAREGGADYV
ncbi:MAG TPA: flagellar motor switch protein FliG [Polyangiales bacterium]|nr:flagellar motor switch protein FliG [Polyangiales bacterium]